MKLVCFVYNLKYINNTTTKRTEKGSTPSSSLNTGTKCIKKSCVEFPPFSPIHLPSLIFLNLPTNTNDIKHEIKNDVASLKWNINKKIYKKNIYKNHRNKEEFFCVQEKGCFVKYIYFC